MLQALARMPQLRHLCLCDTLPNIFTASASPKYLLLPHLQTLLIGGWVSKVAGGLRFLSTPTITSLNLELDRTGFDLRSSPHTFTTAVSKWLKAAPAHCTYHSLSFLQDAHSLETDIVLGPSASHLDGNATRKLTMRVVLPPSEPSPFFWNLLPKKLEIFGQLLELVVSDGRFTSQRLWQKLEAVTEGIREITVFGFHAGNGL
ncbi:hypothetical protein BV25DRAFT_1832408 [Artomyces pyxidatus]|uniref:Uncharacterized protein n=1 Tax=Artomyces pyxidatus TaxID=48021 RepID=A0ACB8SKI5_9AGAM|nr:hypothetical protein BV25DRAFT_1832408 [Artomyces pyxidatus]